MALADYINKKTTIHTKRLIIRPMTEEDVSALKEWMPAMEQKPLWQLQDSVLSIQSLEGFGQKLMFGILHLVES